MDWTGDENSVYKTLGASNHTDKERAANDYYATEPKAAELLLEVESFSPVIWECACGEGHLAEVFRKQGYYVKATDLIDRGYGLGGVDFLSENIEFYGDIITNPPYKYAKEFVEHAIETVADGYKVAMFLKLQFLEGKTRKVFFQKYPPQARIRRVWQADVCKERRIRENESRRRLGNSVCVVCLGKGLCRESANSVDLRKERR